MDSKLRSRLVVGASLVVAGFTAAGFVGDAPGEGGPGAEAPAPAIAAVGSGAGAAEGPAVDSTVPEAGAMNASEAVDVLEVQTGSASYYANSLAGNRTASGVPYDPRALVAAHRTLPFGTVLRVTNLENGREVQVRVVDRGPFARGRILDLSRRAAERIGMIRLGHVPVRVEVLSYGT